MPIFTAMELAGPSIVLEVTATAAPAAPRLGFNHSLHGARGLLALLVFLFHVSASGMPGFSGQDRDLVHSGLIALQFGVEVFFCISGFIVMGALGRAGSPGRFLLDRAIRILPVLWLTLAIIVPLGVATHQGVFAGLGVTTLAWVLPANLMAIAGVLPIPVLHMAAWSLSYELAFYVVAATLWFMPAHYRVARLAVAACAVMLVVWHPRAIFFAVGMLVARVDLARHRVLRHALRAPGVMLIAFMACWYIVQFSHGSQGEDSALNWLQDGRIGLAPIAISLAILAFSGIVAGGGLLGQVLRSPVMNWLGSCSYSFYLWHLVVLAAVKRAMGAGHVADIAGPYSQLVLLAISLPLSLIVAQGSLRLVEQRFGQWLKQHGAALSLQRLAWRTSSPHAARLASQP